MALHCEGASTSWHDEPHNYLKETAKALIHVICRESIRTKRRAKDVISSAPRIRSCATIFKEEEAVTVPHHASDKALVTSAKIVGCEVRRVLVNNGSSMDILYYGTFKKWT